MLTITVGGTQLPGELVSLKRGDETLWSDGTGRGATDGLLVGSLVAKKQTWKLEWGVIPQSDYETIRTTITGGFQTLVVTANSIQLCNISAYRSAIEGEYLGTFGGTAYWKGVSVELIER